MRSISALIALVLILAFGLFSFIQPNRIQKVKMHLKMRSASAGNTSNMEAVLYYSAEGKIVTLTEEPFKTVVINNISGELTLYNFDQNSVIRERDPLYSVQSNNLYFFLQNKKQDLGLAASGFNLSKTSFEDGLKVTKWTAPMQLAQYIKEVELVHDKANPIFIAYISPTGQYIRKTYFYQYSDLMGVDFPAAITEINFKNEQDSVITKTTYSQFEFNEAVENDYLDFKIPSNAKVLSFK